MLSKHSLPHALMCLAISASCLGAGAAEAPKQTAVDFLDYFLQKDDVGDNWTIDSTDVRPDRDPDGTDTQTFILNKFSTSDFYEVFKLSGDELQIRYEVWRPNGKDGKGAWIRRFEEFNGSGKAPGSIWTKRYVTPGGPGLESRYRQDRYVYDEKTRSYVFDPTGAVRDFPNYTRFVWATTDWKGSNKTGFKIDRVLRMISEWQRQGYVFEMYDYAKGKGMVAWRWAERVSTLPPADGDKTGKVFRCENGHVFVQSKGDRDTEPVIYSYDAGTGRKGRRLEVLRYTSYWQPGFGEQWYVIYRDTTKEHPLEKKMERIEHSFALPEWQSKPGATIADLPHVNTHAPSL